MEIIQSISNAKVKSWVKLHTKKGREADQAFFIEGVHLVEEAIECGAAVQALLLEEEHVPAGIIRSFMEKELSRCYTVSSQVMKKLTQTENPQGISAVIGMKKELEPKLFSDDTDMGSILLILDAIQDPGNLGTMIRTADAAGIKGIVAGNGTVDVYNDKVVRSTMGSIFRVPIIQANLAELLPQLREQGFVLIATSLEGAVMYNEQVYEGSVGIVIGNEAKGVSPELFAHCTHRVKVPIYGGAESLNAAVAAGIIMYEAIRQRNEGKQ
jgi:TrmH family RNA methyltransferase